MNNSNPMQSMATIKHNWLICKVEKLVIAYIQDQMYKSICLQTTQQFQQRCYLSSECVRGGKVRHQCKIL